MNQGSAVGRLTHHHLIQRLRAGGLRAIVSIALAGVGVQVLTFISGPIVARMLGADGRGLMVLVIVIASLCSAFGVGGLPAAASHAVGASGAAARDAARGLIGRWALAMLGPGLLAGILTAVVVRHEDEWFLLAVLGAAVAYFQCLNYLALALLQGEGAIQRVNSARLIGIAAYVAAVVIIFVAVPTEHAPTILAIYAASLAGGSVLGWCMLRKPTGDTSLAVPSSEVHAFARQAWTTGLKPLDALGLDQLLVGIVLGQTALGIYSVAVSVTSLPIVALGGVALALLPKLAALEAGDSIDVMRRWVLASAGLAAAMVVGIQVVLGPAIRIFFGDEFEPAIGLGRLLVVAWAFLALRRVLAAAAQAQGRVVAASVAEGVSTVLLAVLAYVGMKTDDLDGVAWAMIAVSLFCCAWIAAVMTWRRDSAASIHAPKADELEPPVTDTVEHRLT